MKASEIGQKPLWDFRCSRVDFMGRPVDCGYMRERPRSYRNGMFETDRSSLLPSAAPADLQLVSFENVQTARDPFVLYNRAGLILYEWDEGVEPDWRDVLGVCRKLRLV